ncbi:MAG TPA: LLM class flavin-dependent oxidoreductase [Deltaproteobacteria bacterium]|nr:LLM class flavin-dependent oxidoreductase [Deltaproteobacteria bacterium]
MGTANPGVEAGTVVWRESSPPSCREPDTLFPVPPPAPPALSPPTSAAGAWGLSRPALGLALAGAHGPDQLERQRRQVALAESLGFHSIWLPEMHFATGGCPAPLVELARHAFTAPSLRFGTTSLLLPLHPPERIAAEIAALDRLTAGRVLVGLGRGFQKRMLEAFGVPPAEKRDRFDAALDRLFALWAEGNETGSALATATRPHPPLAVAAFGPKGLAQAARRGLPYLASPVETLERIAENQARHRALLPPGSERPLSLVMRTVFVSRSETERDRARRSLERETAGRRSGMPDRIREALAAPLDERAIIGTVDEVRHRLILDRRRLEIDLLIVRAGLQGIERRALDESLALLAREIWPSVIAGD